MQPVNKGFSLPKFLLTTLLLISLVVIAAAAWVFEEDMDPAVVDANYSNDQSQFLETSNGARVHFRDQGQPNGPPVLLVHGSNASLHTWEPWVRLLGDKYRVITLDLPGHGLTGAVPGNQYDASAQLNTIAALVEHLGIDKFILGGNSMGGGASWRYALQHQEQIEALVLVDASGLSQWRKEENAQHSDSQNAENNGPLVFRLLRKPWFRSIAVHLDTRFLTTQGLRSAFHDKSKVTQDMIELYYQMSMRAGTRQATLSRFASYGREAGQLAHTEQDLSTLGMPTLILWGATDALTPVANGQRFANILPDAKLIVYPEVGHIPMEEIPERSAADVRAFLHNRVGP